MRRWIFGWLADRIERRRGWVSLLVVLAFAASSGWLLAGNLTMDSSRHAIVNEEDIEQRRLMAYNDQFGNANDILLGLEGAPAPRLRAAADALAERLRAIDGVADVFYKIDLDALADKGMYYLPIEDLQRIQRNLRLLRELRTVRGAGPPGEPVRVDGVVDAVERLNAEIDDVVDGETAGLGRLKVADKDLEDGVAFAASVIDEMRAWIEDPERTRLDVRTNVRRENSGLSLDEEGYLFARSEAGGGELLLMRIQGHGDVLDQEIATPLVERLRAEAANLPGPITAALTGVPVIVVDEDGIIKRDLPLTGVVSAVGCFLLFLVAYRTVRGAAVVFLPLFVGLVWCLSLTSVLVGSLNQFTGAFIVVIIGMGVDFSVHLFTRLREERFAGAEPLAAARIALLETGPPIATGAITSAAAFGAMAFTEFRGTGELGRIAGTGLLLVLLSSVVILPIILGRPGTRLLRSERPSAGLRWHPPRSLRWPILAAGLAVTLWLALSIEALDFDFDANNFLPQDAPSIVAMKHLEEMGVGAVEFAVTRADTLEGSRRQYERLKAMSAPGGTVERIESIFDILPPDLAAKEPIISELRAEARTIRRLRFHASRGPGDGLVPALDGLIERLQDDLPFTLRSLGQERFLPYLAKTSDAVVRLRDAARAVEDPAEVQRRLVRFEERVATLAPSVEAFVYGTDDRFDPTDLPRSMISSFYVHKDGDPTYAIRVYPAGDIANPDFAMRLRRQLRSIDPESTGYALVYSHFGQLFHQGLRNSIIWASIAVILLVFIDLRSLRDTGLALLPLVMGGVWMVGLMNVLGIEYSFSNTVAIPLIIGIGIDSGIHLLHRWKEMGGDVAGAVRTSGKAIIVSSLTTMVAFGSLTLAEYEGSSSLGLTLLLGVTSCMITSLVVLPSVLWMVPVRTDG